MSQENATPNALLLQYPRKPTAQPISVKQQQELQQQKQELQRQQQQQQQHDQSQSPSHHQYQQSPRANVAPTAAPTSCAFVDIVWQVGSLGLRFTPGGNDEPVVCQITPNACDAIQKSSVAVGDVVVAVQVHSIGGPMIAISTLDELVQVFQHEARPITVRFRPRSQESPEAIPLVDIAHSYTYTWQPGHALGVSLAMDPCSLHTIITSIDTERISPDFLPLEPTPGDILISIRNLETKVDLDHLRFDKVVACMKSFPRPCKLTFARLHEAAIQAAPTSNDRVRSTSSTPPPQVPVSVQYEAPRPAPIPSPRHQQFPRRPAPLLKRQSFTVEEMQRQKKAAVVSEEDAKKQAQRDARFYKFLYNGGHIGIVLNDANLELKGKPKKNGYYAFIKKIPNKNAVEELNQASEGDELIAIGQRDLHNVPFDVVQHELSAISSPTPLLFQRRPRANGPSVGASLVDGLLLFLL